MVYIIAVVLALGLDQWFKHWVVTNIPLGGRMELIPGVLRLTHVRNFGAAFGILQNMRFVFIALVFVFIATSIFLLLRRKIQGRVCTWALMAVIAGALGNLVDRMVNPGGYVVDMFETVFMDFAIFNIADIFVVLGGIVLCAASLYADKQKGKRLDTHAED